MIQKTSPLSRGLRSAISQLSILSVAAFTVPVAFADNDVDVKYYGYARSGIGSSGKGGKQACFQVAGAPVKHRLGNECETFTDQGLQATLSNENGTVFTINTLIAYSIPQQKEWENPSTNDGFALRQMNLSAENIFPALPGAKLWAGKKYYRRHDVHQLDWYYWDASGPGAGIEDINLGFGKFHLAWIRNEVDVYNTRGTWSEAESITYEKEAITTNVLDFRLTDIPVFRDFSIDLGLAYGKGSSGDSFDDQIVGKDFYNKGGFMGTAQLKYNFPMGGFNNFVVQYATDAMTGSGVGGDGKTSQSSTWFKGSKMSRVLDFGYLSLLDNRLDITYVLAWTNMDYSSDAQSMLQTPDKLTWTTLGIRPQWKWSELTSTVLDFGWDKVTNGAEFVTETVTKPNYTKSYADAQLYKVTLAQQFHPAFGSFVRPVIRAFVTYANWDEVTCPANAYSGDQKCKPNTAGLEIDKGLVSSNFGTATDGFTFGVQMEAWWD